MLKAAKAKAAMRGKTLPPDFAPAVDPSPLPYYHQYREEVGSIKQGPGKSVQWERIQKYIDDEEQKKKKKKEDPELKVKKGRKAGDKIHLGDHACREVEVKPEEVDGVAGNQVHLQASQTALETSKRKGKEPGQENKENGRKSSREEKQHPVSDDRNLVPAVCRPNNS